MSILPWSYKLAMWWYSLILKRRTSHDKSDYSSTDNFFQMPFQQRKLPATHQCSERKRKEIVFAIMLGDVYVGKRQGWHSWAKMHWEWSPLNEVNIGSNEDASNLLYSGVCAMAVLPWLYELALGLCSLLVQTRLGHAQYAISWEDDTFEVPFFFLFILFLFSHCTARGSGYPYMYTLQLKFFPHLSSNGKSLHQTRAPRPSGRPLLSLP